MPLSTDVLMAAGAPETADGGQLLALVGGIAAVSAAVAGLLTALATRSKGAVEGFRDLNTAVVKERDSLLIRVDVLQKRCDDKDDRIDFLEHLCRAKGINPNPSTGGNRS